MTMFKNCFSLKVLNISNFNTINVNNMEYIFDMCYNLNILDIRNFNSKSLIENSSLLKNISENGIIYYNSNIFNSYLINKFFDKWEKVDVK